MQISNINLTNTHKISFSALQTHSSLYDVSNALLRDKETGDVYQKVYNSLNEVSGNRNLEIRKLGDYGGVVIEVDERGNIIRYISKDFQNLVRGMQEAVLKLVEENNSSVEEK